MLDFIHVTLWDLLDIVSVALIMFYVYRITRGTQAPNIITGIVVIYIIWIVVRALNMEMLSAILGQVIGVGVIALVVVFQPEIRRFLQMIGTRSRKHRFSFLGKLFEIQDEPSEDMSYLAPVVRACLDMSSSKTGALIVIQKKSDLTNIAESGIQMDSIITASILKNIFFKNSPLHDGAVIISKARILAAKCILPSTQKDVPVSFGMRHRAALGISELTDSVVIVVSEETGAISVAHGGNIKCGIEPTALHEELISLLTSAVR